MDNNTTSPTRSPGLLSIPSNQSKKPRQRARRSNKSSKIKHGNATKLDQYTFFYSIYRGLGGTQEIIHPPLFTMHSHAVAWGISRASRDGTLHATNLTHRLDNSMRSLEKIFLDYIGIVHLPLDQVEHQSFESRSAVENYFFSSVNFYALHSKCTIKIKSTYIRIGHDVTRAVLDSFHKKKFQHSTGSIYGKGKCPSLNTIDLPKAHCQRCRNIMTTMGSCTQI